MQNDGSHKRENLANLYLCTPEDQICSKYNGNAIQHNGKVLKTKNKIS